MTETNRVVPCFNRTISYTLQRKPVKNLNLRIRADGSVFVSANGSWSNRDVDRFVREKADLIAAAQARQQARRKPPQRCETGATVTILGRPLTLQLISDGRTQILGNTLYLLVRDPADETACSRALAQYLDTCCRTVFQATLNRLSGPFLTAGTPQLRLRTMRSRWGTCQTRTGIITLNRCLLAAPPACIDYVVLHELCHLIHPDHSPAFHARMTALMPDWKQRRALLNELPLL